LEQGQEFLFPYGLQKLNYIFTVTHASFTILQELGTGEEKGGEKDL
jgi:hypothetical protein